MSHLIHISPETEGRGEGLEGPLSWGWAPEPAPLMPYTGYGSKQALTEHGLCHPWVLAQSPLALGVRAPSPTAVLWAGPLGKGGQGRPGRD